MAKAPTSYGYPGSINSAVLADWLTRVAGARFSVGGKDDLKVTVQSGLDRGIRVNAGIAVGDSVMDDFPEYDTLSLPAPTGTSQWFLVVVRRNWSAPESSNFFVIPGTATRALPARRDMPGQESDQPLALVRVQSGNTVVQEIVDLRGWAGNGGVEAADILGREALQRPGAAVKIGADIHRYEYKPENGGSFAWNVYQVAPVEQSYTPVWTGLESLGAGFSSTGRYSVSGKLVRVTAALVAGDRSSLALGVIGVSLPPGLPVAVGPMAIGDGVWNSQGVTGQMRRVMIAASGRQTGATVWAVPGTNEVIPPGRAGWGWGVGSAFHVSLEYFTS